MSRHIGDWRNGACAELPVPKAVDVAVPGALAALLAAMEEIRALADVDLILRRAVELARDRIGLRRASLFVLDRGRNLMLGTWGMNLAGTVVDEHDIVLDLCRRDLVAFRRAAEASAPFTVFEDCPIVEHQDGVPRIAGRGWVARTPIRTPHAPIAMLLNDAGLTGDVVDGVKQAHAAVFCSTLGALLDPARGVPSRAAPAAASSNQRLVAATVEMLDKNPALGGKEIAAALEVGLSTLTRVFKVMMGVSLVEYRNRLRLDRFEVLLERGNANLLDAALQAGFGSYAQFHRVFRAHVHASPREYLRRLSGNGP